jgi:hypothetical protein
VLGGLAIRDFVKPFEDGAFALAEALGDGWIGEAFSAELAGFFDYLRGFTLPPCGWLWRSWPVWAFDFGADEGSRPVCLLVAPGAEPADFEGLGVVLVVSVNLDLASTIGAVRRRLD